LYGYFRCHHQREGAGGRGRPSGTGEREKARCGTEEGVRQPRVSRTASEAAEKGELSVDSGRRGKSREAVEEEEKEEEEKKKGEPAGPRG